MNPMISVVLGTYNRFTYLKMAVESIRRDVAGLPHEIIVVDGGSTDGTVPWLTGQKDIITIVQHNHGAVHGKALERRSWGYFMNLAFKCSSGKYVCMLSDDCLVVPGAVKNGYDLFEERLANGEKIGAVAFYWRNWPEKGVYFVGLTMGKIFVNHGLYLRQAMEEAGFIDEHTFQFYHADGDLCLKMLQQGYECIASKKSFVEHHSHANVQVRATNIAAANNDWDNYLNKWDGIYYFKGVTETGGHIELDYSDPTKTADAFKKAEYSLFHPGRFLKKIRQVFIQ